MHGIRIFISSTQKEFSKERRLLRKCADAGLRLSEFIQADDFKTIIWRTNQITDQAHAVDARVVELVKLSDKPRKRAELQQLIGRKYSTNFRAKYIDRAIDEGYVTSSHPDTPTHPEQLYTLTNKGITLYHSLK